MDRELLPESAEDSRVIGEPDEHFVVSLRSPYPAAVVLDRLATVVLASGLRVFARIEYSRDAAALGLALPPMAALLFGHPSAGTPVLAAAPLAGLELPLRALAWTDSSGHAWLSYADPSGVRSRYGLSESLVEGLQAVHRLCQAAVA